MSIRLLVGVAFVAVAATGCASENGSVPGTPPHSSDQSLTAAPSTPPTPSTAPTPLTAPTPSTAPTASVPPGVAGSDSIRAAVADLAARLGTTADRIAVVEVQEVTWSDGSLGCPQPGMIYTQTVRNGQLVVLSFQGRSYEYHSGPDRPLFFCADPQPPTEP